MPAFNYVAINDLGRKMRGVVVADNELDLEARLKQLGLDLIDAKEVAAKRSSRFGSIKLKDMIILCMHLDSWTAPVFPFMMRSLTCVIPLNQISFATF
jgi:type IV pilus assembly protein PilC